MYVQFKRAKSVVRVIEFHRTSNLDESISVCKFLKVKKIILRTSDFRYLPFNEFIYPVLTVCQFLRPTHPFIVQDIYFCVSHDRRMLELYTFMSGVLTEYFGNSRSIG